ncbi:MAG TPA: NADH-quinone oxidoreductase subunit L [Clostridia bacterium]|nr:NADH-quinone oxidoreductase subunit L [Clostridia bacterium]
MIEFAMYHAWLVPLLPVLGFVSITFITRQWPKISAFVSIMFMLASFAVASAAAYGVFTNQSFMHGSLEYSVRWFSMPGFTVNVGVLLDPTSVMMLFMVSLVASLIQIYSVGYMHGDKGFSTFFAYMSLFAASMLGLVISSNLLQMFVFWELVGLCSYLLIGFYSHKISAREAAKKAFVTCRVADFGLLLGLLMLQIVFGTLDISVLATKVANFEAYTSAGVLTMIAVLVFIGPIGKSGQFPLHIWLPDAMEGPSPVSALIHAATMVVAGVYLVGRTMFLFVEVELAMMLVAVTGAFTAFFAATIAIAQHEMKRILAYSTISQLGYMMLALGVGSLTAGMFHLWTHAFFKALMFLAAGSVIHALAGQADIRAMGGLVKRMPVTSWAFVIGGLAIAGIPPFAGFWSKDEILAVTLQSGHTILFVVAALTAFLTAFYMWRLIFTAFFGDEKPENQPQESPISMLFGICGLAVLAVLGGFVNTPWAPWFGKWINFGGFHHTAPNYGIMALSVVLAVSGIYLAYRLYIVDKKAVELVKERFKPIHTLLYNKYYVDEVFLWFTHRVMDGLARVTYWIDIYIVDSIVNGIGYSASFLGERFRFAQTGQLQTYVLVFFVAIVVISVILAFSSIDSSGLMAGGGLR